jgi:hypothetical protein
MEFPSKHTQKPSGMNDYGQLKFFPYLTDCGLRASYESFLIWAEHLARGGKSPLSQKVVFSVADVLGDCGENTLLWQSAQVVYVNWRAFG